jgi:hypothetical protein
LVPLAPIITLATALLSKSLEVILHYAASG